MDPVPSPRAVVPVLHDGVLGQFDGFDGVGVVCHIDVFWVLGVGVDEEGEGGRGE